MELLIVLKGALTSAEALLCCGEAGEKEKESAPFPSSRCPPRTFYFFDYCYRYFYGDTQWEPCAGESERRVRSLSQSSLLFHRQFTYLWKHAKKPTKSIDRTWLSAGGGGSAHKNADARMQAINLRSRTTPESAVTIFLLKIKTRTFFPYLTIIPQVPFGYPGFVPFFEQKFQGLFKDFQGLHSVKKEPWVYLF